ncbi:hypothetical protein Ahy_B04g073078 [Arachis hypogaea]|uniref:CASP-like protein n=1 Tax=Arachis hypogaea TaxID=3818 RepID=A0A444ZPL4_ARAHY|nr:hypothetical protein Ahy_B04g073078 [Arachis hypogaea]
MSYLGIGVSPGTAPVYYSTNLKLLDKRIKIAELLLRFMILGLGVVELFLLELIHKYSLIQGLRCVVSLVRESVLFNKPSAWAIFSADQNLVVGVHIHCFLLHCYCLEKISYLDVGVSLGTTPVYHSTNLKLLDKRIKIAELVLRFMILGLGVVAAILIGNNSQVKVFFSFEKEAKFTDVKTSVFLVVANGLAAGYSLIQGLHCVVSLVRGSVLFNKPLAWAIFSTNQNLVVGVHIHCFLLHCYCLEKISYLDVGVSLGTAPVYHSTNLKLLDKRIKIAELVLRFMILGLRVIVAILIGTDSQVKVFFSFEKEAKFTDVKASVFLVVANGLAAGYSLIQGLRCVVSLVRGSVLFNKPLVCAIFSADQIPFYI